MTDIVERLRGRLAFPADEALLREAADEIERLRKNCETWKDRAVRGREIIKQVHAGMEEAADEIERLRKELFEAQKAVLKEGMDADRLRKELKASEHQVAQLINELKLSSPS